MPGFDKPALFEVVDPKIGRLPGESKEEYEAWRAYNVYGDVDTLMAYLTRNRRKPSKERAP